MDMRTIHREGHRALVRFIIKAREDAELRQEDVAKKLGRHQSWVAKIEAGQRRIDLVEFIDLAHAIGFDATKMFVKIVHIEKANNRKSRR